MNGVEGSPKEQLDDEEKKKIYRIIANAQLKAWNKGSGYFYWMGQLGFRKMRRLQLVPDRKIKRGG